VTTIIVAYVPVLHDGYRRFLERHARNRSLYLVGPAVDADYRPLAKDIRAIDPVLVATAIVSWGICRDVSVLTPESARSVAADQPAVVLPAEDISYRIVDRYFERCEVSYDAVFLRWDRTKTVMLLEPTPASQVRVEGVVRELGLAAEQAASDSIDWWRQVGAAMRLTDGTTVVATNHHLPRPDSPYVVGDPRSNFYKGVHLDLSTAMHAEAHLIADSARRGVSMNGAVVYVTDFPCPPCAKLIAVAGVSRLYFRDGYAVLDGEDVLADAGVEVVRVEAE
jgi:dCMP deaminase